MDVASTQPTTPLADQAVNSLASDPSPAAPLWRFLLNPLVAFASGGFVLALVAAAVALPQLPRQLADEPAAAARWFLSTAASFGAVGTFMRSIGLFDVANSLLFRLALAMLTLVIAAHFADQLGSVIAYRRLRRFLCTLPDAEVGPVCIATARRLDQRRFEVSADPVETQNQLLELVRTRFDTSESCRHTASQDPDLPSARTTEFRTLAGSNIFSYYLRTILPIGLLIAMTVVWVFLYFGWELYTPVLAPGDTYRSPTGGTVIAYVAATDADAARLTVQIGEHVYTETVATNLRARLGNSRILGRTADAALLVRVSDGAAILVRPGQSEPTDSVGVVLPSPGSEESILVPSRSLGLRIVRRTDEPTTFFLELYEGANLRPSRRIDVNGTTSATLEASGDPIQIELVPVPGMSVTIRHVPIEWLLWIAALLVLVGIAGVLMPPSILLALVSPWPVDRALVTLYADNADAITSATEAVTPAYGAETESAEARSDGALDD